MKTEHAYDPTDPRYYDEKDLRSELERVFSVCADCRMCVKFCGSFPKMFDAVDDYCTEGKYAEGYQENKTRRCKADRRSLLSMQAMLHQMSLYTRQSRMEHRFSSVDGP